MAIVRIPSENITMTETNALASYLASRGIDYERWTLETDLPPDPTPEHVLAAYAGEVESLKQRGGYVTADVIDVKPDTPNLDAMLVRFSMTMSAGMRNAIRWFSAIALFVRSRFARSNRSR